MHVQVVIQTLPGRAPAVEARLARVSGLEGLVLDGTHRLHGRWREPAAGLESLREMLQAMDADIVAVHHTSVDH